MGNVGSAVESVGKQAIKYGSFGGYAAVTAHDQSVDAKKEAQRTADQANRQAQSDLENQQKTERQGQISAVEQQNNRLRKRRAAGTSDRYGTILTGPLGTTGGADASQKTLLGL